MPASRSKQLKGLIETAHALGLEVTGIEVTPNRIYLTTSRVNPDQKCVEPKVEDPAPSEHDEYARLKAALLR